MAYAIIKIGSDQTLYHIDLDRIGVGQSYQQTFSKAVNTVMITVFEVAQLGATKPGKEYGFIVENVQANTKAQEKVFVPAGTNQVGIHMDLRLGKAKRVSFGNTVAEIFNDEPAEDIIHTMSKRMYFMEELMDLFIMEIVTKEEYYKIRSLYRSSNNEDRQLARTLVERQHEKHINI